MSLSVPPVLAAVTFATHAGRMGMAVAPHVAAAVPDASSLQIEVKYDAQRQEITFDSGLPSSPVRNGDWVVITSESKSSSL